MASFREALGNATKSAVCEALRASERFGDALVYAWQNVTGINASPPNLAGAAMGLLCSEPRSPIYNNPDYMNGGQCECVVYRVPYGLRLTDGETILTGTTRLFGPIRGVRYLTNSLGRTGIEFLCRGNANGGGSCGAFQWVAGNAGTSGGTVENYEIYGIFREDGGSDNCNPNPIKDPKPIPDDDPIRIPFPFVFMPDINFPDVTVDVDADFDIFQPFLDVNANFIVPVDINTNIDIGGIPIEFKANVNINTGGITFNFGGSSSNRNFEYDTDCEDPRDTTKDPPPKGDDVPDPQPDPETEEKRLLVGCLVTVLQVAPTVKASQIMQGANPTIYAPSLGYVNFYCEVGTTGTGGWTTDIAIKNKRQLVECPWEEGAIDVKGTPQPGVQWDITPIYRKVKSQKAIRKP